MNYTITSEKEIVRQHQNDFGTKCWPEFMQHDAIVEKYWHTLYDRFSNFQFAAFENETLVGIGNMIPVYWDRPLDELPSDGVDWAIEKANLDFEKNIEPNLLVAMQILINPNFRGKGISSEMVKIMKSLGQNKSIGKIALPVRPTIKHKYPLIPMDEYINWKRKDGKYLMHG